MQENELLQKIIDSQKKQEDLLNDIGEVIGGTNKILWKINDKLAFFVWLTIISILLGILSFCGSL